MERGKNEYLYLNIYLFWGWESKVLKNSTSYPHLQKALKRNFYLLTKTITKLRKSDIFVARGYVYLPPNPLKGGTPFHSPFRGQGG